MESTTIITLLLRALDRVALAPIFAADPYESRRTHLPGPRLLKTLVVYQMIKSPKLRGLVRAIAEHTGLQTALGGVVARNTLANAVAQRAPEQMIEAWLLGLQHFAPWLPRLGKKFARLAVVDASLIKLSLLAFDWAAYRTSSGAAKLSCVLDWARGIPQQLVVTTGKVHDLKAATQLQWRKPWTYVFDRAYIGFDFLSELGLAGAHFVVRLKANIDCRLLDRCPVPPTPKSAGFRLTSDWLVYLPGGDLVLRLVSYQLPDGRLIRVLTDRLDLSALSVAQLYKERWTIELWFKWLKQMFKIKEPLGRSESALPVQIVGAFVTDLLLRAVKHSSGFTSSLYEFVTRCQELSLTPLTQLTKHSALRRALEALAKLLETDKLPLQLVT